MANNLIGVWKSDPDDVTTQQLYGNVTMDFRENGDLIYIVTDYPIANRSISAIQHFGKKITYQPDKFFRYFVCSQLF
jgi:hypothetical protein